jgi:hypothetical protein
MKANCHKQTHSKREKTKLKVQKLTIKARFHTKRRNSSKTNQLCFQIKTLKIDIVNLVLFLQLTWILQTKTQSKFRAVNKTKLILIVR